MQTLGHPLLRIPALAGKPRATGAVLLLALAAGLLAVDPVLWLVHTWRDPSYDSRGGLVAALVAAIALWSATSPRVLARRRSPHLALLLLAASAVARALGQLAAVNVLGALTLIVDVYALASLARLDKRRRAVSPAWLAVAFAFALPLERIAQRVIGFVLQQISANGACGVLGLVFDRVACEGVRIVVDGRDVLVDLPCSGARTLMLCGLAFAIAATLVRPRARQAVAGAGIVLAAALAGNVARIVMLAVGIAHPEIVGGIDVMTEPWHDGIGLVALATALLPLAAWARAVETGHPEPAPCAHLTFIPDRLLNDGWWLAEAKPRSAPPLTLAVAAVLGALAIVNLPRRPLDTSHAVTAVDAPAWIAGQRAEPQPLLPVETAYFTQYGGAAAKAAYGAHNLLLVGTTSPLRHLHAPDECLRGLGYAVGYLGQTFTPVPTARYVATSPAGQRFRIDVSFVSSRGDITASVGGAVWLWLTGGAGRWTEIQRISPATLPEAEHAAWSATALATLGIDPPPATAHSLTSNAQPSKGDAP